VAHVRENGAMNCIISSEILDVEELKKELAKVPNMDGLELASYVSTRMSHIQWEMRNHPYRIAVNGLWNQATYYSLHGTTRRLCKSIPSKNNYR
jgi:carbamoylphosphate synthase small subunit